MKMGIEAIAGGTVFAIVVAYMVLKQIFKMIDLSAARDKASRLTIDNHIDHNTETLSLLVASNDKALTHMTEASEDRKENRRTLITTLEKSTEASTKQVMIGEQVVKALDRLTDKIDK
jgi:uncharacterized membrane protein YhiD involved in acid resistance